MDVRIATCRTLPAHDEDSPRLIEALARRGIRAARLAWDDPGVDWDAPVPTVIRSTWNYIDAMDAFDAWLVRVARAAPLYNPIDVVRACLHKRYLVELAARGVPVVPTVLLARGATVALDMVLSEHGWTDVVVKPAVGAGSSGARRFRTAALAHEGAAYLRERVARGDTLVQPYIPSVEDPGERSLVWIDGEVTHVVRKARCFAGEQASITGPFQPESDERALAEKALAPWADRLLYARVDTVRDAAGRPMIAELELAEPLLFLGRSDDATRRMTDGIVARLAR